MSISKGFTLIELMVVVVIIAILAAISLPQYQKYLLRNDLAVAKQESLRLANELERFKAKNFSFKGFDPAYLYASGYTANTATLLLPVGSTASNAKYILTLVDRDSKKPLIIAVGSDGKETADSKSVNGLGWLMKVERAKVSSDANALPKEPYNYDLLLKSDGFRCMTRTNNMVTAYSSCGTTTDVVTW